MRVLLNLFPKRDKLGRKQWFITVKSKNGRILTTSPLFSSKQAAITNAHSTQKAFKRCWRIHDTVEIDKFYSLGR